MTELSTVAEVLTGIEVDVDQAAVVDGRGTALRILDTAISIIEAHGEAGLRMGDLVDQSRTTVGSVYHFYGSREGVIEAVRAHQFEPVTGANPDGPEAIVQELIDTLELAQPGDDLLDVAATFMARFFEEDTTEHLWQTYEIIGSARLRPGLRHSIASAQGVRNANYARLIELLQEKGMIKPEFNAWTLGVFVQAFANGRLLGLMDESEEFTEDAWAAIVLHFLESVLVTP